MHSEAANPVIASNSSLFLHFVNRELLLLKGICFDEKEHVKNLKCFSLMTCGYLLAPFAQVQEIYWHKPLANTLIAELCGSDKLHLCNGASDFHSFIEHRREIYSGHNKNYKMYFGKSQEHKISYRPSPCLNTTDYIKKTLYDIVGASAPKSNLLDVADIVRLKGHAHFIRNELQDSKAAATFTVYGSSSIQPKPEETRFFGRLSSKLFVEHYSGEHGLIVPTGVFDDPAIEDFDHFPLFDLQLNGVLFHKIGLGDLLRDAEFNAPLLSVILHEDFPYFTQLRVNFVSAVAEACGNQVGSGNYSRYKMIRFINDVPFTLSLSTLITATKLVHTLSLLIERASSYNADFKIAFERLSMSSVSKSPIAIFTATELEDEVFLSYCAINKFTHAGLRMFDDFTASQFKNVQGLTLWHIRTSAGSGGVHGSTRISEFAVKEINPLYAFSVGIAFGLDETTQALEDVLISEYIHGYEKVKIGVNGIEARGDRIPCSPRVVSFSRQYYHIDTSFKVHTGGILSGEKLVNDPAFRAGLIALDPKAIGGEMETLGLAQSCHLAGIEFVKIKGVSDFAAGKDDKSQKNSASNAFKFLFSLIDHLSVAGLLDKKTKS